MNDLPSRRWEHGPGVAIRPRCAGQAEPARPDNGGIGVCCMGAAGPTGASQVACQGPAVTGLTQEWYAEAVADWQRAQDLRRMAQAGQSYRQMQAATGVAVSRICRLLQTLASTPDAGPEAFADARHTRSGATSAWAHLVEIPEVASKLRELHVATLGASCEAMTSDRRTGAVATALRLFAREPECPEGLRSKLLAGKFPTPLKAFLAQLTPEAEAVVRGSKHATLAGPTGHKDRAVRTIGLPDGRRARLPANWTVVWDDMSVNQPYWVEGPDGNPILCRQSLISRDLATGRWQTVELVARVRDAYTAADILRSVRRYCELYGVPRELHLEQSVWASNAISGWRVDEGGGIHEETIQRPGMAEEEKANLSRGLEALGITLTYQWSARGKAMLEGGFNVLQRYLAAMTRDMVNVGRHAGEFERAAREVRRVKAGVIHPKDAGFPHANALMARILECFDFLNSLVPDGRDASPEQSYQSDQGTYQGRMLTAMDKAAFLPQVSQQTIRGAAVWPQADGRQFCFRSEELVRLGDGYQVTVRWDPTDPSLGAAIYNREGDNLRNWDGAAVGQLLCLATYDVPGPTTRAESVPDGLETWSVEELHGAASDGGAGVKAQRRAVRGWVRTVFGGRLPGQPRTVAATARDGRGATAVASQGPGGAPASAAPERGARQSPPRPAARTAWVDPLLAQIEDEEA